MKLFEILPQLLAGLVIAIASALITVHLALRRFYREKWWEAKMRAYAELLTALHYMKRDLDLSYQAHIEQRDTDNAFYKAWSDKHRAAWDEIRKDADVGEFLFSPEAVKTLQTFINESEGRPDEFFDDYYDRMQAAISKCLPAIKEVAKRDLKLPFTNITASPKS